MITIFYKSDERIAREQGIDKLIEINPNNLLWIDLIEPTDEEKNRILVDYRAGDIFIPKVENKEALSGMAADFVSAIINNTTPISNYQSGLDVISILEASQKSIKNQGREIII